MDADFWEEVERSRRMTPEQRFQTTLDLISLVNEFRMAGIRRDFPNADDEEVVAILRKRIEVAESLGRGTMKPEDIVRHVLARLESLRIPYVIVGSFATNVYGVARATKDADFVVQVPPGQLGILIDSFKPELDCDRQIRFESITGTQKIELNDPESAFTVELFWHSEDPHDQERFSRRQEFPILGRDVWILSREDVLVTKLRWLLIANRPKDRIDIKSVIAVQGDAIDWPYVESWCDRHGTRELLEQIHEELGQA